ncbi:MAG: acyltransferase [Acidimicrobiia bacterium]
MSETQAAAVATAPGARYQALDGLRGFAMVSVFLFHGALTAPALVDFAPKVIAHLDTGVQVFFVLSGFLIYRQFAAANLSRSAMPVLGRYALRRAARIYPAYWLALAVLVALGSATIAGHPVRHILLIQTYYADTVTDAGLAVAWTLTVEISFYVLAPLWSLVVRRLRARPFVAELGGVAVLFAVGLAARLWSGWGTPPTWVLVLPTSLCTLSAGMLLAVLASQARHDPGLARRLAALGNPAYWWWIAAGAVFALQCALPYGILMGVTPLQLMRDNLLRVPVAFLLVVPAVFGDGGVIRRALQSAPMVFLGVVSYGMYLWHTSIIQEFESYTAIPSDLRFVVAFFATLAVATASWYVLEGPVLRWAHHRTR